MESSRFLDCLALTLERETGYRQPVGGPYRRARDGAVLVPPGQLRAPGGVLRPIPAKPDGMAFDDDPQDTGGRTGMGLLQREYSAWCQARGKPARDVWTVTDGELEAIYAEQYWNAVRADELPAGVRLAVFDMAVNCGVGRAVRLLQAELGVKADGHMGAVTIAAAAAADPADLVERLRQRRAAYYRQCRTFRIHGRNWLARTDWVAARALGMAEAAARTRRERHRPASVPPPVPWPAETTPAPAAAPEPAPEEVEASPARAAPAEKTPTTSVTIWTALLVAVNAVALAVKEILTALGPVIESPTFWLGIGLVGLAAVIAGERLKKFASSLLD